MKQQNIDKTKPIALVYCRVSTDKQEQEGTSLDSQAKACIEYAKANGYQVGEVVQEVYSGAYLFDRPKINEQRAKIRAGAYDAVIVYAIDRLSRDVAHLTIIHEEAERYGCKLDFVTEKLENTAEGKLMLSVKAYVAEVERQKIRERSMRGRMSKLQAGKLVAHSCDLYGYTVDRKNGVRLINFDEAEVVKRIFREYLKNQSIRAIAKELTADGIPTPSNGKKVFKAEKFRAVREFDNSVWGTSTISKILNNETYAGITYANQYGSRMVYKNGMRKTERFLKPRNEWVELPGVTPAIISETTFKAAQKRKPMVSAFTTRNKEKPVLLRGLVFCKCGRQMYPEYQAGRKEGQYFLYYRCASRGRGSKCPYYFGNVSGGKLDNLVWDKIETIFTNPAVIKAELEQRSSSAKDDRKALEADIVATKQAISKNKSEVEKLVARIAVIDDSVFDIVNKQIADKSKEVARLEQVLEEAENRLLNFDNEFTGLATLEEYADMFSVKLATIGFDERRLICEALGLKIVANSKNELNLMFTIPTENEVINLIAEGVHDEDLRYNSTDSEHNSVLSGRRNRANYNTINKTGRYGECNGDSDNRAHGDAR